MKTKFFALIAVPVLSALVIRYSLTHLFECTVLSSFFFAIAVGLLLHFGATKLYRYHFLWEEEDEIPLPPPKVKRFWTSLFNLCLFSSLGGAVAWIAFLGNPLCYILAVATGAATYNLLLPLLAPADLQQRGRMRITSREAIERGAASIQIDEKPLLFGRVPVPHWIATMGILFIGAIGAGKTLLIKLLGKSVFPLIGKTPEGKQPKDGEKPSDLRAVVFDAKQDMMSYLHRVAHCKIVTLNALDLRCGWWNISKDINEPIFAAALAEILIPRNPNQHQPYFDDAARELLQGVVETFIELKIPDWTLFDLVHACTNKARLEAVLEKTQRGMDLIQTHLQVPDTSLNVLSTLLTKVGPFRFVAYAWDRAKQEGGKEKEVCLHDFIHGEPSILVLGCSHKAGPTLQALNQLIMKRLGQIILDLPDSRTRKIWFFIDEARMAGKFDGLSELVVKGRSKGVCAVLGIQDLDGFFEVYGEKLGSELIGQFANRCILGLRSQRTAEWASKLFGDFEGLELHESTTDNSSGSGTTTSYQLANRHAVLASQFDLPQPGRENGLAGYYLVPHIEAAYKDTIPWEFIEREILSFGNPWDGENVPDFVPRPVEHQYARPWSQEDLKRLGIQIDANEEEGEADGAKTWPNAANDSSGDQGGGGCRISNVQGPKPKKNRLRVKDMRLVKGTKPVKRDPRPPG